MRVLLTFKLANDKFTKNYRNFLMSYFKFALSKEYIDVFNTYFNNDAAIKNYSFSVYIKDMKYEDNLIVSPTKSIKMILSSNDYSFVTALYNSLLINKGRKMDINPDNKIFLERISLIHLDEIKEDTITIKTLSPILVRDRDRERNKDYYVTVNDSNFIEKLNFNLIYLATHLNLNIDNLKISPIKVRKVVVPLFKVNYDANDGLFELSGNIETLNTLYKVGIGSRRGEGFGLFELVKWLAIFIY